VRALGWRRDKFDPRDAKYSFGQKLRSAIPSAPATFSLKDRVARVLDQGNLGSCVGCGTMQAVRIAHVGMLLSSLGNIVSALAASKLGSVLWAYYFGRAAEHMTGLDSGCQIRNCITGLVKLGLPIEEVWPYSDSTVPGASFQRWPGKDVFDAAFDQIGGYHRIDSNGSQREEDVRLAISSGRAVIAGWDVSEQFCSEDPGTDLVDVLQSSDRIAGGHCMIFTGYSPNEVELCNSWGKAWGMSGFFRGTWNWVDTAEDIWMVDVAPLFIEEKEAA
jgi:hypothetical protein